MGWAAISLRKMTLKQRIDSLNQRLMHISQEQQSLYDSSSYAQQAAGVEQSQMMTSIMQSYQNNTDAIKEKYKDKTDQASLSEYNTALQEEQMTYSYNKMIVDSMCTGKSQAMQDTISDAETRLSLEQEQLQTQLEAAQAEYDSLEKTVSDSIQKGAIKLTA